MFQQRPSSGVKRAADGLAYTRLCALLSIASLVRPASADTLGSFASDRHFVIGGVPTEQNAYPWVVALTNDIDANLFQRQFCGGSVIADRWVLTAAHCLFDRSGKPIELSTFKVAVNASDLSNPDATEIVVTNMYIHPNYDPLRENPMFDIALLELANDSGVEPIRVSAKSSDKLVGLDAKVIGWGAVDNADPTSLKFPVELHEALVPIVAMDVCNAPESYQGTIYPNQLCAGYAEGGIDSCTGDSGGPLFVNIDGVVQQVGVVSYGYGCALPNYYGIYSDVPYYIGWINQYVQVAEPEFEPEPIDLKSVASIPVAAATPSDLASSSWMGVLVLLAGVMLRRRIG